MSKKKKKKKKKVCIDSTFPKIEEKQMRYNKTRPLMAPQQSIL